MPSGGGSGCGGGGSALTADFEPLTGFEWRFMPQELSNVLYAFARAAHPSPALYTAAAQHVADLGKSGITGHTGT